MNPRPWLRIPSRPRLLVLAAIVAIFVFGSVGVAHAAFDPELIISNANMRATDSMSEADIQAFLETQPGVLKDLKAKDYLGVKRPASAIIYRACQRWDISPKVMLTMLQKEQSLLTRTTLAKNTLKRAIGAGCPDANTNRYPGFGNQMYHGARLLSSYGEFHSIYDTYYVGIKKAIYKHPVYGKHIHPKNLATFKLYVYNPSIPGNTNFYKIYTRYFGSPFANPRYMKVYRFTRRSNGSLFYTTSLAQVYKLKRSSRWAYNGRKYSVDTSVSAGETTPLYRFRKKSNGKYYYTASKSTYKYRRSATGRKTWAYSGVAFPVALNKSVGSYSYPLYRFKNRRTGATLLTTSKSKMTRLRRGSTWRYQGVDYYLPRE